MPGSWFCMRFLAVSAPLALALAFGPVALAQQEAAQAPLQPFSPGGADTCLRCHDEGTYYPVVDMFKTPHGVLSDPATPFANAQCEACHAPGGDHGRRIRAGETRPPLPAFGRNSIWTVAEESAICASCHQDVARTHWDGSAHERYDVGCASCHTIHATRDPVTQRHLQSETCFSCHTRERAQSLHASAHPIRQGEMTCSDCHQPHGSLSQAMLNRPTLNETCYDCHAEKRGPLLWEHAPVTEDCSTCHEPHGSNHQAMLRQRAPLLCQGCHSRADHPGLAQTGTGLPGASPSRMLLSNSCGNCHSQVHGSNHPSGSNLSR